VSGRGGAALGIHREAFARRHLLAQPGVGGGARDRPPVSDDAEPALRHEVYGLADLALADDRLAGLEPLRVNA
jgi:hypothetical protein